MLFIDPEAFDFLYPDTLFGFYFFLNPKQLFIFSFSF